MKFTKLILSASIIMAMVLMALPLTACRGENGGDKPPQPPIQFTVSFNTLYGSFIPSQTIQSGQTANRPLNNPTRLGYNFVDWFTTQTGGTIFNFQLPITSDTTVFARWTNIPVTQHIVSFNQNGGIGSVTPQLVNDGSFAFMPSATPTRSEYDFLGWFTLPTGGVLFNFTQNQIMTDTILYAQWEPVNPVNPFQVRRAEPTQTPTTTINVDGNLVEMPFIYDSFTDGTYNFFLLDIGTLRHTFLANIIIPTWFPGFGTLTMNHTTTNSTAVTQGATSSMTNSLTTTTTAGLSSTLSSSIQLGPQVSRVTAGISVTADFSVTQAQTQNRSWSTNVTEAVTEGTTDSLGYTITSSDPMGYYRAALFATSEIFIILQTTRDNSALIEFDEIVLATGFTRRVEFSPAGIFDNTPQTPIYLHNMYCEYFLRALPLPIPNFTYVSAGSHHSLAVTAGGQLWSWGSNQNGITGLGTIVGNTLIPRQVGSATNWVTVSAGEGHSLAINSVGRLYAWGDNFFGITGLNTSTGNTLVPRQVGSATNWAKISAGGLHSLGLTTCGQLWSWGSNRDGITGLGTIAGNTLVPRQVGFGSNWASISAGGFHSLATNTAGQLYAWGSNASGKTGFGIYLGNTLSPRRVGLGSNWASVSAGGFHSLAVNTAGQLFAWGSNASGATGLNLTTGDRRVPTQVGSATNWATVSAGGMHSLGVTTSGQLWSWGSNFNGRTGLGINVGNTLLPTRIGSATNWATVSASSGHSFAINQNNNLWSWGSNLNGQLGDGSTINRYNPV